MTMQTAYIALGSNLGDRAGNLHAALGYLRVSPGVEVVAVSSFMDNEAIGGPPDSPRFLNAVAEVRSSLDPHQLLARLMEIEREMGRVRSQRNEPRIIDLDLVMYGDVLIRSDGLDLPHPRMHERAFVLKPLAEIAPNAAHPLLKLTMRELLDALERRNA